jgi:hypothetical protein
MEPAASIRRLGFLRWYERRLIEGHAWFISGFCCMILVAVCMEELAFKGSLPRLLAYVALVLAASLLGIYGFVRYQKILIEAERIGERATCPACGVYGRFKLVTAAAAQCRKCSHEWQLIL